MTAENTPLLQIENLTKVYHLSRARLYALDGVSFDVEPGEAVALVGESGSGKSTLGYCVVRLEVPTAGRILFMGQDLTTMSEAAFRPLRRRIQMVFQDPRLSLNPRLSVRQTLSEPLLIHKLVPRNQVRERVRELLTMVNLEPELLDRRPHELSGGQCQRVAIARAIASLPEFIVLDEPTSSLDMSIRAQIITLLRGLQEELGMAYLFITHDLSTVRSLCRRTVVLYLGRVMEVGFTEDIFTDPKHPYTKALISSIPIPDPTAKRARLILPGETPSPTQRVQGCPLANRCPYVMNECRFAEIPLIPVSADGRHRVACLLYRSGNTRPPWADELLAQKAGVEETKR